MIAPTAEPPPVHVADGLDLDASQACTQTLGAIAAKGGGKSYLAGVIVEGLYAAAAPFAVFDPIGNWNAVTLDADGKSPGLAVVVIGGERADVPLDEDVAELIGGYVVERGASVIFDVSELSKARRKTYVANVAEAMFRAARKAKRPFMVIFEEAQLFAPQVCPPGEQRMLGAVTDIVRLGRNHGLGSMLITQRPQSVSKEVLNQVECLFVGQLRGPQERKAIAGWISEQSADDARAGLDELPKLAPGEFFCWSPAWLRTFRKVRVAKKRTFDGSSTPTLGKLARPELKRPEGFGRSRGLETIISALGALGEVTAKRAKDAAQALPPGKLEAENAALREQVQRLDAKCAENARTYDDLHERFGEATRTLSEVQHLVQKLSEALVDLPRRQALIDDVNTRIGYPPPDRGEAPINAGLKERLVERQERRRTKHEPTKSVVREVMAEHGAAAPGIDGPMRNVLSVLAWQRGPIPKARLALLARYSAKGGAFNNVLSRCRVAALLTGSDPLEITAAGRAAIGHVKAPPRDPAALFTWWLEHPRMDGAMAKILQALRRSPRPLSSTELALAAGYKPATGGFNNPLSRLRVLGLVLGKGSERLRLAPELIA